jgi:hypothetical protein
MTPGEAASLILAAAGLLTAIATLVATVSTALRLTAVHDAVNGQSKALVDLTAKASFAAGVEQHRSDISDVPAGTNKTTSE